VPRRDNGGSRERERERAREGGIMRRNGVVYDGASMSGRRWVLSPVNGADNLDGFGPVLQSKLHDMTALAASIRDIENTVSDISVCLS
jgi:hypothetical protein